MGVAAQDRPGTQKLGDTVVGNLPMQDELSQQVDSQNSDFSQQEKLSQQDNQHSEEVSWRESRQQQHKQAHVYQRDFSQTEIPVKKESLPHNEGLSLLDTFPQKESLPKQDGFPQNVNPDQEKFQQEDLSHQTVKNIQNDSLTSAKQRPKQKHAVNVTENESFTSSKEKKKQEFNELSTSKDRFTPAIAAKDQNNFEQSLRIENKNGNETILENIERMVISVVKRDTMRVNSEGRTVARKQLYTETVLHDRLKTERKVRHRRHKLDQTANQPRDMNNEISRDYFRPPHEVNEDFPLDTPMTANSWLEPEYYDRSYYDVNYYDYYTPQVEQGGRQWNRELASGQPSYEYIDPNYYIDATMTDYDIQNPEHTPTNLQKWDRESVAGDQSYEYTDPFHYVDATMTDYEILYPENIPTSSSEWNRESVSGEHSYDNIDPDFNTDATMTDYEITYPDTTPTESPLWNRGPASGEQQSFEDSVPVDIADTTMTGSGMISPETTPTSLPKFLSPKHGSGMSVPSSKPPDTLSKFYTNKHSIDVDTYMRKRNFKGYQKSAEDGADGSLHYSATSLVFGDETNHLSNDLSDQVKLNFSDFADGEEGISPVEEEPNDLTTVAPTVTQIQAPTTPLPSTTPRPTYPSTTSSAHSSVTSSEAFGSWKNNFIVSNSNA